MNLQCPQGQLFRLIVTAKFRVKSRLFTQHLCHFGIIWAIGRLINLQTPLEVFLRFFELPADLINPPQHVQRLCHGHVAGAIFCFRPFQIAIGQSLRLVVKTHLAAQTAQFVDDPRGMDVVRAITLLGRFEKFRRLGMRLGQLPLTFQLLPGPIRRAELFGLIIFGGAHCPTGQQQPQHDAQRQRTLKLSRHRWQAPLRGTLVRRFSRARAGFRHAARGKARN